MTNEEKRDRVIEIIIVAQLSMVLMAAMFYYFVRLPHTAACQTRGAVQYKSSPTT